MTHRGDDIVSPAPPADGGPPDVRTEAEHVLALDGLRGVAVILVVLLHAEMLHPTGLLSFLNFTGPFSGGFIGVDIFFVLSGFLITRRALRETHRHGRIRFGRFWRARALRLLPALFFMLGLYLVYAIALDFPGDGRPATVTSSLISAATFTANWKQVLGLQRFAADLGHLWSLSIEEQFYLVWPIVLTALLLCVRRSAHRALPVVVVLFVALGFWRWHVFESIGWITTYVRTDTHCDGIVAGCAAALAVDAGLCRGRFIRWAATVAVVVLAGVVVFIDYASAPIMYRGGLTVVALATAAIILAISDGGWWLRRVFEFAPFRLAGRLSFGIYLWHFTLFKLVIRQWPELEGNLALVVAFGATAAVSAVSWFAVERPTQALRRRLDSVPPRARPATLRRVARGSSAALVAIGAAATVVAATLGHLAVARTAGDALPHLPSLRALAFLDLHSTPPAPQVMADSLFVGGRASYSLAHTLPAIVRLPVTSLWPDLGTWLTTATLVVAWLIGTVLLLAIARQWRHHLGDSSIGRQAIPTIIAAALSAAWGLSYLAVDGGQNVEGIVWMLVAGLWLLGALLAAQITPTAGRLALAAVAVVAASLAHPVLGVVGLVGTAAVAFRTWKQSEGIAPKVAAIAALSSLALLALAAPLSTERASATTASVSVTPQLDQPTRANQLLLQQQCPRLLATNADGELHWATAEDPSFTAIVQFPDAPAAADSGYAVQFAGPGDAAAVVVESNDAGLVRFSSVGLDNATDSEWSAVRTLTTFAITVTLKDGTYTVLAEGHQLGTTSAAVAGSELQRYPRIVFGGLLDKFGVKATISPRSWLPTALCDEVIHAAAAPMRLASRPPETSGRGELVAVGSCDAVLVGTGDETDPWNMVEARPRTFKVSFDRAAGATTRLIAVSSESDAITVSAETDGRGNARFRFDQPYANAKGAWFPIDDDTDHLLTINYLAEAEVHVVSYDGTTLAIVPGATTAVGQTVTPTSDDFWFEPSILATPGQVEPDGIVVATVDQPTTRLCSEASGPLSQQLDTGPSIPDTPSAAAMFATTNCTALVAATPSTPPNWDVIEVAPVMAAVRFDGTPTAPFDREVITISKAARISIRVESDGAAHARVVVSIPYLTTRSDWLDVRAGTVLDIGLVPQISRGRYIITLDGTTLAALPLTQSPTDSAGTVVGPPMFETPQLQEGVDDALPGEVGFRAVRGGTPVCDLLEADHG